MGKSIVGLTILIISILLITACGESKNADKQGQGEDTGENGNYGEDGSEHLIKTYFMSADENHIILNVSEARADYVVEESGAGKVAVNDMLYSLHVKRTEELEIVHEEGEEFSVDKIQEGDKVYLNYDIEDYEAGEENIAQAGRLIVRDVTPEDMMRRFAPATEDAYYIGIVNRDGWGDYNERELAHLLDYNSVQSFGSIMHRDDVPAYDYVEAFEIEAGLPIFFIISQDGLEYKTDKLGEVEHFLDHSQ
ncbi:hypothetical protein D7Z54_19915 [Salibacterium salarium]|uniref:Uncharacterized protein n=1 Tax=Salibacterium salarium TaxID=284579 RepID=A0A428MZC1_9BACI|nr:hypothetical protein [Salibacterium salarium]RSL31508.1 hypothetical protein D7Z54_19915 [Salibacterium salarium]